MLLLFSIHYYIDYIEVLIFEYFKIYQTYKGLKLDWLQNY